MSKIDWIKIKNEYINTNISYRKLAEKHGVSTTAIANKAKKENWTELKEQQLNTTCTRVVQKTQDKIVTKEVNRIDRLTSLADRLADKLEQSIEQLDNYLVTNKKKVKTVEYDNKVKGKPSKEIVTETEELAIVDGIIDTKGLKSLASALKDIKDVQVIATSNKPTTETSQLYQALESEND